MGVGAAAGETPSLTGEFIGETHKDLEGTQPHPPGNRHQKGPIYFWVLGEVTEIQQTVEQAPLLHLGPYPPHSITAQPPALPHPVEHLRLRLFK